LCRLALPARRVPLHEIGVPGHGGRGAFSQELLECAPFSRRSRMPKVLILGAGKIGALISGLLAESGSYEVHLADVSGEAANAVVNAHRCPSRHAHRLDATDTGALDAPLKSHPVDAVISGLPYYCNIGVAEA